MIDWHSHILPCVDDGSQSTEQSLALLRMLAAQGVKTVVATPHFYAERESVKSFLARREDAFRELSALLPADAPQILLGAEVRYYPGISGMTDLQALAIEGTGLLLLEMPMCRWSERMVHELTEISCAGNVTVVLAHIDRYGKYVHGDVFDKVKETGVLFQISADAYLSRIERRRALSHLKNGIVDFVGSDCHDPEKRAPHIKEAYEVMEDKLGFELVSEFLAYQERYLI